MFKVEFKLSFEVILFWFCFFLNNYLFYLFIEILVVLIFIIIEKNFFVIEKNIREKIIYDVLFDY